MVSSLNLDNVKPEQSLGYGHWVKLICGASNEDLISIEDLCGIYTLAGVDCIDVAASVSVVAAANRGINWAVDRGAKQPWLMISLSDGEDPHFRKASFDHNSCPEDCARPCQDICPTLAISSFGGIISNLCYGCGRCLPICPSDLINTSYSLVTEQEILSLIKDTSPNVIEIHTQLGRLKSFSDRLKQLHLSRIPFNRVAISFGLEFGLDKKNLSQLVVELWIRYSLMCKYGFRPIWQLDGRPMSGDIGAGTAYAAVRLLTTLSSLVPPGPLQLAGGTNSKTLLLLAQNFEILQNKSLSAAGVAFGSIARRLLQPLLREADSAGISLREYPLLRDEAVRLAYGLISPWRRR
uniref:Putative ldpA protein n=1 Tax=Paulinella chromatophora TaxID=39717 RepID=B1X510_PAUCH|nr:putative ldpA protein [Paulinella chromatophora]ACB43029.1 putative ldpA protein [Paulinella chromatophora]